LETLVAVLTVVELADSKVALKVVDLAEMMDKLKVVA
jgi:hypothetical protein